MTDIEGKYFQMVKGIGAIEQRISFYFEQADFLFDQDGDGSVRGLFYQQKAFGLQEALKLLQGE